MAEPRDVKPGEREILEHSLKGGTDRVYRNHFVADPTTEDGLVCLSLVEQGLMVKAGYALRITIWRSALDRYRKASSGLVYFHVTKAGAEAVGLKLPDEQF